MDWVMLHRMRTRRAIFLIAAVGAALIHTCSREPGRPREAGAPSEQSGPASLAAQLVSIIDHARTIFGDSTVSTLEPFLIHLDTAGLHLPTMETPGACPSGFEALITLIYENWGIQFDQDQYRIESMFPHTTVASGRGSCLGVSLLFLLLSERFGLPVYGVVLPGHFFVRYDDGTQRFNGEPNRRGYRYTDEEYRVKYGVSADSWYDLRNLTTAEVCAVIKYNLANICRQQGRLDAAIELYTQAGSELAGFAEAFGNLGLTYELMGKYEQAVGALLKAKTLRPGLENLCANLGTVYLKTGRVAQAAREYEDGLRMKPDDADLLYGLGLARFRQNEIDRAAEVLRAVIRLNPGHAQARKLLGEIDARTRG